MRFKHPKNDTFIIRKYDLSLDSSPGPQGFSEIPPSHSANGNRAKRKYAIIITNRVAIAWAIFHRDRGAYIDNALKWISNLKHQVTLLNWG